VCLEPAGLLTDLRDLVLGVVDLVVQLVQTLRGGVVVLDGDLDLVVERGDLLLYAVCFSALVRDGVGEGGSGGT
jgi:hypothetical protein